MNKTPIKSGILQSDLDVAGFNLLNYTPGGGGTAHGIPAGGTAGQSLTKIDATDYNAQWSTVTGGSGSNPLITVNVKSSPYNAVGDGVADDTVAIQNAINAVCAAGGGTVFFPRGWYLVNGAFDVSTNSILKIPQIPNTQAMTQIELRGEMFSYAGNGLSPQWGLTTHSRIMSTKAGTGTEPAILACNPFQGYGYVLYTYFNNIVMKITNLGFSVTSPLMDALRLDMAGMAILENVNVQNTGTTGTPNSTTGIWMPSGGNYAITYANNAAAAGFGIGFRIGEHFRAPSLLIGVCNIGLQFLDGHEPSWVNATMLHCQKFVQFTGLHSVELYLDIENATAGDPWFTSAHIDDPSNFGGGLVKYNLIDAGVGYSPNPIIVNGGARINLMDLHGGNFQIASAAQFLVGPDARFSAITGGVKLEVRNASTGTWVEATRYTNP